MSTEIPPNVVIEPIWLIEATFAPDAATRRTPVRTEHIIRIMALRDSGTIIEGGAFADMSGSLLLVRAADEQAALAIVQEDVYTLVGVWVELRARKFGRASRPSELPSSD